MSSTEEIRKAITDALEEIRKHVEAKAIAQVELDKHDALLKKANERYLSLCVDLYASSVAEAEGRPIPEPSPQDKGPLTTPMTHEQIISYAIDKRARCWTWDEIAGTIGLSRRVLGGIIRAANVAPSLLRRRTGKLALIEKRKERQKKALQMLESGCSIQEIAKSLGVRVSMACRLLTQASARTTWDD